MLSSSGGGRVVTDGGGGVWVPCDIVELGCVSGIDVVVKTIDSVGFGGGGAVVVKGGMTVEVSTKNVVVCDTELD